MGTEGMTGNRRWLLVLLLLACSPAVLRAQHAALHTVKNARLYSRLTLAGGGVALGRVEKFNSDSVWLRFDREPVSFTAITRIEVRKYRPDSIINGTALGAAIGAGVGLLLTTVCIGCSGPVDEDAIRLGSTLLGAVAGFTVDIAREEWH
jgi:hypothetical protein